MDPYVEPAQLCPWGGGQASCPQQSALTSPPSGPFMAATVGCKALSAGMQPRCSLPSGEVLSRASQALCLQWGRPPRPIFHCEKKCSGWGGVATWIEPVPSRVQATLPFNCSPLHDGSHVLSLSPRGCILLCRFLLPGSTVSGRSRQKRDGCNTHSAQCSNQCDHAWVLLRARKLIKFPLFNTGL